MNVNLRRNEEDRLLAGHPWVFSNEVNRITGYTKDGDICDVYSFDNQFLGRGYINVNSKIIVRLLTREKEEIDYAFFKKRIQDCINYRKTLGYDNSCRLIFAEADLIPGLIVDKYDDVLVLQALTLGIDVRKEMICDILMELLNPRGIYERSDVPVRKKEGLPLVKGWLRGGGNPCVIIDENNIKINVDIENGQKTGYFLDQKENRANIKQYCQDGLVLDCFSHTGGFALNACLVAKKVIAADISERACQNIMYNASLNNFSNLEAKCVDVFDYLRSYLGEPFDCIILDPPAFTKTKDKIQEAYRGYKEINMTALKLIKKGGFLVTCSCSQHMSPALFLEMLNDAAVDAKRTIRMIEFRTQAKDHPTLLGSEESLYLKCVVLNVL